MLDEINELNASDGKDVQFILEERKKSVILYTPHNRPFKAHIVPSAECAPETFAQSGKQ